MSKTEELTLGHSHEVEENADVSNISLTASNSSGISSARSRRRAAKAISAESPTSMSLANPSQVALSAESPVNASSADTTTEACTCDAEPDRTWEESLRRYTPDPSFQTDDEGAHLAKNKPPLGPIKTTKYTTGLDSPTNQSKKFTPSRLPKVHAKVAEMSPSGASVSRIPKTPRSTEKPGTTPRTGTPQMKLSLKPRNNRSHSLDNSEQGLSLLSDRSESSPAMKRSSSLSQRPDWVT